jgi:hypothetical protein
MSHFVTSINIKVYHFNAFENVPKHFDIYQTVELLGN